MNINTDERDCDAPIKTNAAVHLGKLSFVLKMRTLDFLLSLLIFHTGKITNDSELILATPNVNIKLEILT